MKEEILETLEFLVRQKVIGAEELLSSIKNAYGRKFENLMTEAFSIYFISNKLKLKITHIEGSRKILSPYRAKEKSCDIKCENLNGETFYFEVKDCCKDTIRSELAGIQGYTPSSGSEIRCWISNKVYEAIQKGANYLIVRIPVSYPSRKEPSSSDIDFEIFLTDEPQDEIPVDLSVDIPSFFRGIYVIKPFGHKLYKPRNVQQDD